MMPPVDPFMGSSYRGGDPEHKTSCPAEEETAGGMQLSFAGQSSRGEGTQHSANSQRQTDGCLAGSGYSPRSKLTEWRAGEQCRVYPSRVEDVRWIHSFKIRDLFYLFLNNNASTMLWKWWLYSLLPSWSFMHTEGDATQSFKREIRLLAVK